MTASQSYGPKCCGSVDCAEQYKNDQELEDAIDRAALRLETASTARARRDAWAKLQHLVKRRSVQQVARMERSKGLR